MLITNKLLITNPLVKLVHLCSMDNTDIFLTQVLHIQQIDSMAELSRFPIDS